MSVSLVFLNFNDLPAIGTEEHGKVTDINSCGIKNMDKDTLVKRYFELGKELESVYGDLNFKNHCYWRIALDNVLSTKWDLAIDKPAYKNLIISQLEEVVDLLMEYKEDRTLLLEHNRKSLNFRSK